MIGILKSRTLTTRVRCEQKDRLDGVKRVNASRVQNAMLAFNAVKAAFEKELSLRQNMKEEVLKIVKSDIESLKSDMKEPSIIPVEEEAEAKSTDN